MSTLIAPAPRPVTTVPRPGPAPNPWRAALLAALAVWAVTTVARLAVSALAALPRRDGRVPDLSTIMQGWNQWDAQHYVTIAESGYHQGPGYPAFFPLYPLLVHLLDPVLPGGAQAAAVVVANAAGVGALAVLHRLAGLEFGALVARRATWYLAATPMGFFLFLGYNESLFLLLAVGALYAGRRGHWWVAGALAGLSSATRLFGVLLMIPLAVEYLRRTGWRPSRVRPDVLGLALVPLGVVAFSLYCWVELGDPLAFSTAQDEWHRRYTVPGEAWLIAVRQIGDHGLLDPATLAAVLDAGATLIAVVLLVLCVTGPYRFRRDQMYLVVQAGLTLIMLMSTEVGGRSMQSAARYVMEAVAIFFVLARIGANEVADRAVLVTGMALHAVFLVVFMSGAFLVA